MYYSIIISTSNKVADRSIFEIAKFNNCLTFSGNFAPGLGSATAVSTDCDLNAATAGGVYLIDKNPDNDGSAEGNQNDKEYVLDGVCWNTGSGSDDDCNGSADPMIAAGAWSVGTYVDIGSEAGLRLVTNGNNDDGTSDWTAIPEFSTLLMPIASVLLIVGYNYRRKSETTEN